MTKSNYRDAVFVSDLDGTLLDSGATLPKEAVRHLNILHEHGIKVTFATARTIKSTKYILEQVPTTYPVSLMNGVLLCDLSRDGENYISAAYINEDSYHMVQDTLASARVTPFVYSLVNGELVTSYTKISIEYMENFMRERVEKYNKPFTKLKKGETPPGRAIYFAAMGEESLICLANEECGKIPQIRTACYRDSYAKDVWYLEVFDEAASKRRAVSDIRKATGASYIVAFGDNFNDVPMCEGADEAYAVETAPTGVISAASGVIPSADMCGVTRKIAALTGIEL